MRHHFLRGFPVGGLVAAFALFLGVIGPAVALCSEKTPIENIFRVWKERQERVRTIHFVWSETRTYGRGSMPNKTSIGPADAVPPANFKPKVTPEKDVSYTSSFVLSIDGALMRFTNTGGLTWSIDVSQFVARDYVSVFDGTYDKVFFSEQKAGKPLPGMWKSGHLAKGQRNQDVVDYHVWPMLLTWRAMHPSMGRFKPQDWRLTDDVGILAGRECVILRRDADTMIHTCWVDVERDCSIVSYRMASPDRPVFLRLDITYASDKQHGWVPSAWSITKLLPKTGTLEESAEGKLGKYELNHLIGPDTFQFEFPPGTEVTDYTRKKIGSYIALAGGGKRIITDEERDRGARHEEFLVTESGMAGLPKEGSWLLPGLITVFVVTAGFAGCVWWRKRAAAVK